MSLQSYWGDQHTGKKYNQMPQSVVETVGAPERQEEVCVQSWKVDLNDPNMNGLFPMKW